LLRRTLLHEDGGTFRFLHDSFIYYFAAVAVRGYRHASWNHARNDIEGEAHPWYEQTASRLHEAPRAWAAPAEFLGGMLQPREMSDLAFRMIIAAPKEGWPTVLIRLLGGRRQEPEDTVVAGIEYALHHKESMVEQLPAALRTEVYHYLRDGDGSADCREFAARLEKAEGCAWLCSLKPTRWSAPLMRAHLGTVTCVGLMPGDRVVSGSEDGKVLLWDPSRRRAQTLIRHEGGVNCLSVSSDGSTIVSGGSDNAVRRWTRQHGEERTPLIPHSSRVNAVAVNGDGTTVVWGDDNTIWRWTRQSGKESSPLIPQMYRVTAMTMSGDGDTIVWGDDVGAVRRWTSQKGKKRELLITHRGQVNAVAVSGDGAVVVSGGDDNEVRRWARQGGENRRPLITHESFVLAVALRGNTVVSGGRDGAVRRWTHEAGVERQPIITHEGEVRAVAVSCDGNTVVSGGDDNVVRRWTQDGGEERSPAMWSTYRRPVRRRA
jgi:WD40 repeat protein